MVGWTDFARHHRHKELVKMDGGTDFARHRRHKELVRMEGYIAKLLNPRGAVCIVHMKV